MRLASEVCRHFGVCGGCKYQDIPYERQLEEKSGALRELFADLWAGDVPVTPSPVLWHYRNKVDPGFALMRYPEPPPEGFERESVLGYKQQGRWFWPLDIDECRIAPEGFDGLLKSVREWRLRNGLVAYDTRRQTGYLRTLLVRDGKRSGERMVVLITAPGALPASDAFVAAVRESFAPISIYHGEYSGRAEVAAADRLTLLDGKEVITETLCVVESVPSYPQSSPAATPQAWIETQRASGRELSFRVSPFSFFQTNPLAAERLYGHIRDWVAADPPAYLYDLYGGAGGIALACADLVGEVTSVENVESASVDGRFNAQRNSIDNVTFVTDSMRQYLRCLCDGKGMPANSAAIVDPPRSGMHPKAIRRLMELCPRRLLYVSCNPKIVCRELTTFLEKYVITHMCAVDMFPHTPHVELVIALEAK